jgi:hypothetical protein
MSCYGVKRSEEEVGRTNPGILCQNTYYPDPISTSNETKRDKNFPPYLQIDSNNWQPMFSSNSKDAFQDSAVDPRAEPKA